MTKTVKVMAAAVSVVLAGTMAVGLTACGKKDKAVNSYGDGVVNMALAQGTTLNVAIGYNSQDTGLFYGPNAGETKTFVGGYQAFAYGKKPAAEAIEQGTGLVLSDKYAGDSTSNNLGNLVTNNSWGSSVDLATADLTVASQQAAQSDNVLNLAKYLDYMPNFKAFLEANPIVYLSVMGEGMKSDGSGQELYVAPYFDGMDDIEKSVLMRQDWVEAVLDENWNDQLRDNDASNDVFQDVCYAKLDTIDDEATGVSTYTGTHATSYMGTTGSWTVVSTAEPGDGEEADDTATVTIKKDYDAAKTAFGTGGSGLSAYQAIAGTNAVYTGGSGNIVDIMNAAIDADTTHTGATGEKLAALYKAYISTAYTVNDSAYYGTETVPYSKVFTGYSACWDVDDLTALLRIIKCSSGQVGLEAGQKTTGIFPRDYTNSRTPDLISLVGELYGARGATSRYEQVYFDKEGKVQDARNDAKFWDSLVAFGGIAQEGLVDCGYVQNGVNNSTPSGYTDTMHGSTNNEGEGFMQWDYSQTQTTQEFDLDDIEYGWVNNPVSIWDDGTKDEQDYSYVAAQNEGTNNGVSGAGASGKYMRFTDSWRSTKTSGLVVAKSVEKDEKKLAAALTFVDYLYSNDGQITTTYAIQSTNGNSNPNGTWYGTEVTSSMISSVGASDYTELCEENYQYVIKDEYSKNYVVFGGKICDKDGVPAADEDGNALDLNTYADKISYYTVKSEYQGDCFAFGGKLYSGTLYKGKMTPTITTELFQHFTATSTDSDAVRAEVNTFSGVRGSFTNFARYILGSTLPICVKDQSFENQMTANYAKDQATKVSVSLANNTIMHCTLDVTENNYFYTCVPTGFPFTTTQENNLNASSQNKLRYETGTKLNNDDFYSMFHHIIWYGYTGEYTENGCQVVFGEGQINSTSDMLEHMESLGLSTRISNIQSGWETALNYWAILKG